MPRFLLLIALPLFLALPALAEGGPPAPPAHGHPRTQAECRPLRDAPHPRSSEVPLRGDRSADLPPCGRRPGPLHHLFHGHRR